MKHFFFILSLFCLVLNHRLFGEEILYLRNNLSRAAPGDYIVTAQNKNYSLLHIFDKQGNTLTIEEISAPISRIPMNFAWKNWVSLGAPGHTSWVMYDIDLQTSQMLRYFSFTKNSWFEMSRADNFLSTLLNLRLVKIPLQERKRLGAPPIDGVPEWRKFWQPQMIVDGAVIPGVTFDAWRTKWPKDGTELSGLSIEVYTPEKNELYPAYFPYWLQVNGLLGKAKVRIIDSGSQLQSPRPPLPK